MAAEQRGENAERREDGDRTFGSVGSGAGKERAETDEMGKQGGGWRTGQKAPCRTGSKRGEVPRVAGRVANTRTEARQPAVEKAASGVKRHKARGSEKTEAVNIDCFLKASFV